MPAHELVKLFKARKASPVEATKAALARIDAFNGQLNAFQHLDPDSAMRQARASEKRWKKGGKRLSDIDGVPITIKDMVLTKGMPTRMGSLATDPDGPFNVDAPVAQRLREAGTVLLGKTTSPEYGWKGVTDSRRWAPRSSRTRPTSMGMDPRKVLNAHWQSNVALLLKNFSPEKRELMDPGLLKAAEYGAQLGQEAVVTAIHQRQAISAIMNQFMAKYDLLLTPTMPMTAFAVNENAAWGGDGVDIGWTPFTLTFNLTRQPAADHPLRPRPRGHANRPADRRRPHNGRPRNARRGGLRTGPPDPGAADGASDLTERDDASDGNQPPDASLHRARRGAGRRARPARLVRRAAGGAGADGQAGLAAFLMAALHGARTGRACL
ncbi:Amidase [Ostertagia ostertagi]